MIHTARKTMNFRRCKEREHVDCAESRCGSLVLTSLVDSRLQICYRSLRKAKTEEASKQTSEGEEDEQRSEERL
jgi:hypothetical protein